MPTQYASMFYAENPIHLPINMLECMLGRDLANRYHVAAQHVPALPFLWKASKSADHAAAQCMDLRRHSRKPPTVPDTSTWGPRKH